MSDLDFHVLKVRALMAESIKYLKQNQATREAALNEVMAARNTCTDLPTLQARLDTIFVQANALITVANERHEERVAEIMKDFATEEQSHENKL